MSLYFNELYSKLGTQPVSLANILSIDNIDVSVLEGLRELSSRRDQCAVRHRSSSPTTENKLSELQSHIDSFERYLSLLHKFLIKAKQSNWDISMHSKPSYLWTTALSSSSSFITTTTTHQVALATLSSDHMMILCYYASALQELAYHTCHQRDDNNNNNNNNNNNSTNTDDIVQQRHIKAVSLYRTAAAIFSYIKTEMLPFDTTLNNNDKTTNTTISLSSIAYNSTTSSTTTTTPIELTPQGLETLETLSLAQAQSIAALRAEHKRASPQTLIAVHKGAYDLYECAALEAKAAGISSERFRKYLAISSELHASKAYRWLAEQFRSDGRLDMAVVCLQTALKKVSTCIVVAGMEQEWTLCLKDELKVIDVLLKQYDKERTSVYMQGLPDNSSDGASVLVSLPEGRVVISKGEFSINDRSVSSVSSVVGDENTSHHVNDRFFV